MRRAWGFVFLFLIAPLYASAHEVYVLSPATVAHDVAIQSPNPFSIIAIHVGDFELWAMISIIAILTALFISLFHGFEDVLDPFLFRIKRYAPLAARLTLGTCLIACGYYYALFGPELPLGDFAGNFAPLIDALLYVLGAMILFGFLTRFAALAALIIFASSVLHYGTYMLTYANYLGEMLITLILGGGAYSVDHTFRIGTHLFQKTVRAIEPYAFLILRILFGSAVIFASYYAKFLHSQLALDTVSNYHLTTYFPFDPLFVVLGAFIIEVLIGIFFIIGFEIRFTALVFLTFLTLSLLYFGEVVWPHLVLLGVNIVMIMHGYDRYTLEHYLTGRGREPVL